MHIRLQKYIRSVGWVWHYLVVVICVHNSSMKKIWLSLHMWKKGTIVWLALIHIITSCKVEYFSGTYLFFFCFPQGIYSHSETWFLFILMVKQRRKYGSHVFKEGNLLRATKSLCFLPQFFFVRFNNKNELLEYHAM